MPVMDGYDDEMVKRVNAMPVDQLEARHQSVRVEMHAAMDGYGDPKRDSEAHRQVKLLRNELRAVSQRIWVVKAEREGLCPICGAVKNECRHSDQ